MFVVKNCHVKLRAYFYTSRKPGDELLIDQSLPDGALARNQHGDWKERKLGGTRGKDNSQCEKKRNQPSRQRNSLHAFSRQKTSNAHPRHLRRGSLERLDVSAVKEVILLLRPTATKVPKYQYMLGLQQYGLISSGCTCDQA